MSQNVDGIEKERMLMDKESDVKVLDEYVKCEHCGENIKIEIILKDLLE